MPWAWPLHKTGIFNISSDPRAKVPRAPVSEVDEVDGVATLTHRCCYLSQRLVLREPRGRRGSRRLQWTQVFSPERAAERASSPAEAPLISPGASDMVESDRSFSQAGHDAYASRVQR